MHTVTRTFTISRHYTHTLYKLTTHTHTQTRTTWDYTEVKGEEGDTHRHTNTNTFTVITTFFFFVVFMMGEFVRVYTYLLIVNYVKICSHLQSKISE